MWLKSRIFDIMTLKEKLLQHVLIQDNGCWNWTGRINKKYGSLFINGKYRSAHRLSFSLYKHIITTKDFICHTCDNPICVNPEHLYAGTMQDNMNDKCLRGRHHNSVKTHCPAGHEYNEANTSYTKKTNRHGQKSRFCKICRKASTQAFLQRQADKVLQS